MNPGCRNLILTLKNNVQEKAAVKGGILVCFWAVIGLSGAQDVWLWLPWDVWDRLMLRGGCRYELSLQQHDFNPPEPHYGKCSWVGAIFSCFWALTGAQMPPEEQFRVSRNGYRFIKRGGPQHDFNHPEQCLGKWSKNAMLGGIKGFF